MKKDNRFVVIMAGGVGSRFWPLSRQRLPKQFLDILGTGETLLQQTYRRFINVCPEQNIFVVTSQEHAGLVAEQLGIGNDRILAEPFRRNTAPCVAFATYRIFSINPDAVIAVTPADHLIGKQDVFEVAIDEGYRYAAENDALLTIGIRPDRPETGYGYIQANEKVKVKGYKGLKPVKTFTEKPNLDLAKVFIESGDFYWNSGIFIWGAGTILSAFEIYMPDMYAAFEEGRHLFGTGSESQFISHTYTECSSISIDYGIMEKADNVFVICTDMGWSDLGTWSSLVDHTNADPKGNSMISGKLFGFGTKGNIINVPGDKILVASGLEDYIVVDSGDVLLIVPKASEQSIKEYLDEVRKETGGKFL
ncbi:MAG: mannose-1-phosphate guanylyltransferase [Bacteroidales bacterium]|jgi:mannose-1-phosphate guanylyltransferase|nr:mannose-1-phosphate guanylyltransferase [Bacteroidales bacterium]